MYYLKYIIITILLYVTQTNAICSTDNLVKIDEQQVVTYLKKQPLYERQNTSNLNFFISTLFALSILYFIDQKIILLPFMPLTIYLDVLSNIDQQTRESRICNKYHDDILKHQYLARAINDQLVDIETFLYHSNNSSAVINKASDNIIELFCDWIILYRRDLRSSFFSIIDRNINYNNFNTNDIMNIDVSASNKIERYSYLKKINFKLTENSQIIKTEFLVNTLQQSGIHLITNNNHKYMGIIKNYNKYYLLFGIEIDITEEKESNSIVNTLQNKLRGSNYIDPECYALVIKFNLTDITQTIVPFLYGYFGELTKVDLYEITLADK